MSLPLKWTGAKQWWGCEHYLTLQQDGSTSVHWFGKALLSRQYHRTQFLERHQAVGCWEETEEALEPSTREQGVTGCRWGPGLWHKRSAALPCASGFCRCFLQCLDTWQLCAMGWTHLCDSILKNAPFLLVSRLSLSTVVWPQAVLHRNLKILGLKVLWGKISSFYAF